MIIDLADEAHARAGVDPHVGERLVGFQALPFERGPPVLEEAPRPSLALIAPQLVE